MIVDVLATRAEFLGPSGYFTLINRAFAFRPINVFGCLRGAVAKFEPIKYVPVPDF